MFSMVKISVVVILINAASTWAILPAAAQSTTLTSDQAISDLERLYSGLQSADAGLFIETPKEAFDSAFEEVKAHYFDARGVSTAELHKDFQRFAALARHGHTRIDELNPIWNTHLKAEGRVFPLTLQIERGEVIVAGAPAGSAVRPGDRIISLDGKPNPIWLSELTRNISAETPELAYSLLVKTMPYVMLLEYGSKDQFAVEVIRDGKVKETKLDAVKLDVLSELIELDGGFQLNGRDAHIVNKKIAYLRPGGFFNLQATKSEEYFSPAAVKEFQDFIDRAFMEFLDNRIEHLILDLRDNPGGDNSFSDLVIAWFADKPFRFASDFRIRVSPETTASNQRRLDALPNGADSVSTKFAELFANTKDGEFVSFDLPYAQPREGKRFTGEVHVLVNRYSYSNAVSAAALIQDYDFGTVYGEPTRDMATTYGAMEHFKLPNSGFSVGYPKAHIIRSNGKKESHPVTPDVPLPTAIIRRSDDVMLEALVDRLEKKSD